MHDVPAWKPLFERSVAAFYAGDFDEGRLACDRLLGVPDLPGDARDTTRRNAVHYARPLADFAPGWTAHRLDVPTRAGWSALNPVIVPDREDGSIDPSGPLRVLVRSANFRLDPPASYVVADGSGIVRTAYHLLELDDAFEPISAPRLLRDLTPDDGMLDPLVRDNEDLRPFRIGNRLYATGQTWRRAPGGERNVRTALFDLDVDAADGPVLGNPRWLSRGAEGIDEKNWMPVVRNGDLAFVYRCAPTVVVGCDPASGALHLRAAHDAPLLAEGFRGGSALLPAGDGFLALVHEVAFWDGGARTYVHRLVRFDGDLRITALTHPFRFHAENIEFAIGLARRGGDLLISYGVMDREAWIASVPEAELAALLRPVPWFAPAGAVSLPLPRGAEVVLGAGRDRADAGGFPVAAGSSGDRVSVGPKADPGGPEAPISPPPAAAVAVPPGDLVDGFTPAPVDVPESGSDRPFLVSMTLCGSNRDQVGDALRSVVGWVDACLLIDTGITDDTLEVARAIAGDKLVVRSFPWVDDFAAARNAALAFAAELGAEWALFVDTDERIELRGADPRAYLAATWADAVFLYAADGAYQKERFFRLPSRGSYAGPTHECWIGPARDVMPDAVFRELPKDEAAIQRKLVRDVAILRRHSAAHPDDPRWWYYLGDTLANLRQPEEAVAAFERCFALDGWDEEAGWSAYRIARLLGEDLKRWDEAEAACARGLTRHPTMVELYWAAGYAAFWGGNPQRAANWARAAIALNDAAATGFLPERVGFVYVPAHWEAPWDVLRHALLVLGDEAGAADAEHMHEAALLAREQGRPYPVRAVAQPAG